MGALTPLPDALAEAAIEITPELVRRYAQLTGDYNPLHLDPQFAAGTQFGRPIAHGTCSLNALWESVTKTLPDRCPAGLDLTVTFVAPVYVGERVTAGGMRVPNESRYEVWVKSAERLVIRGELHLTQPGAA
jgi:acyl dehydratase